MIRLASRVVFVCFFVFSLSGLAAEYVTSKQIDILITRAVAEQTAEESIALFTETQADIHANSEVYLESTNDPELKGFFRRIKDLYRKLCVGREVEFYLFSFSFACDVAFEVWNPSTGIQAIYVQVEYLRQAKPTDHCLLAVIAHELGHEAYETLVIPRLINREKLNDKVVDDMLSKFQLRADRKAWICFRQAGRMPVFSSSFWKV